MPRRLIALGRGESPVVHKVGTTGLGANVGTTTLFTPPANGMYRVSGTTIVTTAATTSSTLPSITIGWTDADSNVAKAVTLLPSNTGNTAGTIGLQTTGTLADGLISAKAGVAITYSTSGYATSGATSMVYALRLRLEYLGAN